MSTLEERRKAALARLARTQGRWAMADQAVAHIHAQRTPVTPGFRERTGPSTNASHTTTWARFTRPDTERETALRATFVRHFNRTDVYRTPEDPEPYRGVRA